MKHALSLSLCLLAALAGTAQGQSVSYTSFATADTFVSSGQPAVNFGAQGAVEIAAPNATQPRTLLSLTRFNATALRDAFDADFGAGNWTVTDASVTLFSNFATAGRQPNNASFNLIAAGNFDFGLLGNNTWGESTLTWNTLPDFLPGAGSTNTLDSLGTFFWPATGASSSTWNLNAAPLGNAILAGGDLTLFGQPSAGSSVSYLFNTVGTANPPRLNVTASAVPEPTALALLPAGLLAGRLLRRRQP
ncbi:MAG: PEP-CTERM sorting domain-containing protein [Verrucomicrobiota bacterium]